MKRVVLLLSVVIFFALGSTVWGVCEADTNDQGVCDTMYIEPWPDDIVLHGDPPYFVRVPIYVTTDLAGDTAWQDSIEAFVIPLCYTHSNASKYCSVSTWWNNADLYPFPTLDRSIFRHLERSPRDTIFNRMMTLSEDFSSGTAWDTRILDFGDEVSHFWFSLFPTGMKDKSWWDGSRILLATVTFKLEDRTTICIDTCFWPPGSRIEFTLRGGGAGKKKIPRPGNSVHPDSFKTCFSFGGSEVREIETSEENRPSEFSLSQNYPNPFNPTTNFNFTLAKPAQVKIDIFNIVGQKVRTLVDDEMKAGVYLADWDGKDDNGSSVSSGIYFYRMQAGDFSDTKKMVLVK
jgi:hypothetical protein